MLSLISPVLPLGNVLKLNLLQDKEARHVDKSKRLGDAGVPLLATLVFWLESNGAVSLHEETLMHCAKKAGGGSMEWKAAGVANREIIIPSSNSWAFSKREKIALPSHLHAHVTHEFTSSF